MKSHFTASTITSFTIGLLLGGFVTNIILENTSHSSHFHSHHEKHPIADPTDGEYHVHADFRIFVGESRIDLSDEMFMTTASNNLSEDAHLHDGNGEVKHIHAEDLTFSAFLKSLDIELTSSCLTMFNQEPLCSGEENEVLLYVNGELFTSPISQYVPVDDDSILLYYGNSQDENIQTYIEEIPDDSCYYSGTCPERGVAPPESCGLTCEL